MLRFAWLAALILLSACNTHCTTPYTYRERPAGYNWKAQRAPKTGDIVFYGIDPTTHKTVYVGPDNRYYTFRARSTIAPLSLRSQWCPHDISNETAFSVMMDAVSAWFHAFFAHHDRLSDYNYVRRPSGYHWIARHSKQTGAIVYYGVDPVNGWTVYVGPDGIYYTFPHRGEIRPSDLQSLWDPHAAL